MESSCGRSESIRWNNDQKQVKEWNRRKLQGPAPPVVGGCKDYRAATVPSVPGRNGDFNRRPARAAVPSDGPGHLFDQTSNDPTSGPGNRRNVRAFRKPLALVSKDQ